MPPNTVTVSRPSIFGNPFTIDSAVDYHAGFGQPANGETPRETAVKWFREWLAGDYELHALILSELHGKNLACWCRLDQPCHADVLLEIANR